MTKEEADEVRLLGQANKKKGRVKRRKSCVEIASHLGEPHRGVCVPGTARNAGKFGLAPYNSRETSARSGREVALREGRRALGDRRSCRRHASSRAETAGATCDCVEKPLGVVPHLSSAPLLPRSTSKTTELCYQWT